jgi:hypothetical protein
MYQTYKTSTVPFHAKIIAMLILKNIYHGPYGPNGPMNASCEAIE